MCPSCGVTRHHYPNVSHPNLIETSGIPVHRAPVWSEGSLLAAPWWEVAMANDDMRRMATQHLNNLDKVAAMDWDQSSFLFQVFEEKAVDGQINKATFKSMVKAKDVRTKQPWH